MTRLLQASFWPPGSSPGEDIAPVRPAPRQPRLVPEPPSDGEAARQELESRIAAHVPQAKLALAMTDNRYTMISVKREKGLFRLRLHHMFLDAAPEVVRALGEYVARNDREASRMLGHFIDVHQRKIRRARRAAARPVALSLQASGDVHDLQSVYDELNQQYFAGAIDARITWGQRLPDHARRKRRSSIKMGSYSVEDRLIRIHPSLDRPFVPRMFVAWIVFHEMLHQKHDIPIVGGRRQFHTAGFLAEEARFQHYEAARRWERDNLDLLLTY